MSRIGLLTVFIRLNSSLIPGLREGNADTEIEVHGRRAKRHIFSVQPLKPLSKQDQNFLRRVDMLAENKPVIGHAISFPENPLGRNLASELVSQSRIAR